MQNNLDQIENNKDKHMLVRQQWLHWMVPLHPHVVKSFHYTLSDSMSSKRHSSFLGPFLFHVNNQVLFDCMETSAPWSPDLLSVSFNGSFWPLSRLVTWSKGFCWFSPWLCEALRDSVACELPAKSKTSSLVLILVFWANKCLKDVDVRAGCHWDVKAINLILTMARRGFSRTQSFDTEIIFTLQLFAPVNRKILAGGRWNPFTVPIVARSCEGFNHFLSNLFLSESGC